MRFVLCLLLLVTWSLRAFAQTIPAVDPVISPSDLANSFSYKERLQVQDVTNLDTQDLIFTSSSQKSPLRIDISVGGAASILTPEILAAITTHSDAWDTVSLANGTTAFISKQIPLLFLADKGKRFDLKIALDLQESDDKATQVPAIDLHTAIQSIYDSISQNYRRLISEQEVRKEVILSRRSQKVNSTSVPGSGYTNSLHSTPYGVAKANLNTTGSFVKSVKTKTTEHWFIFVSLSALASAGIWFVIRRKRRRR